MDRPTVCRGVVLACAVVFVSLAWPLALAAADAAPAAKPSAWYPICTRETVHGQDGDVIRTRWGYMDRQGQVVIAPQYEEVGEFHGGRARVRLNGRYGFVDTDGKLVVPPTYVLAGDFSEGLASVAAMVPQPQKGADSEPGLEANTVPLVCRWGLIDTTGALVAPPILVHVGEFREGLAPAMTESANGRWGYVDRTGRLVIGAQFTEAHAFREGVAVVRLPTGSWGAIDPAGKWVLAADFDFLGDFSGGLAVAFREPKVADNESMATKLFTAGPEVEADTLRQTLLDGNTGEVAAKLEHAVDRGRHRAHVPGDTTVRYKDGAGRGYADLKGTFVIPAEFVEAHAFVDGLALVALEQDTGTATAMPAPPVSPKRGRATASMALGYGYIGRDGNLRVGGDYADAQDFSEGLAVVWTGTDWAYVDTTGKRASEAEYAFARPYRDGLALVTRRLKEGLVEQYVDPKGQSVGPVMPVPAPPPPRPHD